MEKCGYRCEKCKAVDKMEKDFSIFRFPKMCPSISSYFRYLRNAKFHTILHRQSRSFNCETGGNDSRDLLE